MKSCMKYLVSFQCERSKHLKADTLRADFCIITRRCMGEELETIYVRNQPMFNPVPEAKGHIPALISSVYLSLAWDSSRAAATSGICAFWPMESVLEFEGASLHVALVIITVCFQSVAAMFAPVVHGAHLPYAAPPVLPSHRFTIEAFTHRCFRRKNPSISHDWSNPVESKPTPANSNTSCHWNLTCGGRPFHLDPRRRNHMQESHGRKASPSG